MTTAAAIKRFTTVLPGHVSWPPARAGCFLAACLLTGLSTALMPWGTLVIVSLTTLFLVMLTWPAAGVYLLIFLVPVTNQFLYFENPSIGWLFVATRNLDALPLYLPFIVMAALAVFLTNRARKTWPAFEDRHFLVPVGVMLVIGFACLFRAPDLNHSLIQYGVLVTNALLFYAVISALNSGVRLKTAVWCIVLSGVLQSLTGLVLYCLEGGLVKSSLDLPLGFSIGIDHALGPLNDVNLFARLSGTQESHTTAMILAATFPMVISLWITQKRLAARFYLLAAGAIILVAEVMTLSRGGMVGIIGGSILTFLLLEKLRPGWIWLSGALVVICVVLIFGTTIVGNYLVGVDVEPRLVARTTEAGTNLAGQAPARLDLWRYSFKAWSTRPILGLGPGNTQLFMRAPHAHSIYFSLVLDFGLAGLLVIAWFGLSLLWRLLFLSWKQATDTQVLHIGTLGGLAAVLVQGLIDFEYNTALVWLYLGIFLAASNLTRKGHPTDTHRVRPAPVPRASGRQETAG